jgi:hypothetical protein
MTAASQPDRSPAPGIIPDPVHVHDQLGTPTLANGKTAKANAERRNLARIGLAKMASAVRGDKHMVDAYPAAGREPAVARDDAGSRGRER